MEYPLSRQERGRLWLRLGIRAGLTAGAAFLLWAAAPLLPLFLPFVPALVLAWGLNPVVNWLMDHSPLPRRGAALAVLALLVGGAGVILFGVGRMLAGQMGQLFEQREPIMAEVLYAVDRIRGWVERVGASVPGGGEGGVHLLDGLAQGLARVDLSDWLSPLAEGAADLVSAIPGFAVAALVFLLAVYFITADYPRLCRRGAKLIPGEAGALLRQIGQAMGEAFGGWLKSQLLLSSGVFLILCVGLLMTGQPYSLLLSLLLSLLDLIPILGAGTVLVPWAAVELLTGDPRHGGELLAVWGLVAVFRRVAEPKVMGKRMGLSPILSLAGVYAGMKAGGVVGMVLGPVLLLTAIDLSRRGLFRPAAEDLKRAVRDVAAILRTDRSI